MLKKGDVISYGATGVCKVEGECEQTVKGQKKRYIVLKPVHQANSTLYVPIMTSLKQSSNLFSQGKR